MRRHISLLIAAFSLLALSAGCAQTGQGSRTYTREQAQTAMTVTRGTVVQVSEVQIQRDETGVGAAAGGVAGGVVGSTIGGGRGTRLATVGGALGGAAAGSAIEGARNTKAALEIEVDLEDGRYLVIVQEADDMFSPGEQVRVIERGDGNIRVRKMN